MTSLTVRVPWLSLVFLILLPLQSNFLHNYQVKLSQTWLRLYSLRVQGSAVTLLLIALIQRPLSSYQGSL